MVSRDEGILRVGVVVRVVVGGAAAVVSGAVVVALQTRMSVTSRFLVQRRE